MSSRGRRAQCRDSLGRALRDACHDYHPRVLRPRIRSARRRSLAGRRPGDRRRIARCECDRRIAGSGSGRTHRRRDRRAGPHSRGIRRPGCDRPLRAGGGLDRQPGEGSRLARPRAGGLLSRRARRRPCPAPGGAAGPDDDLSRAAAARLPSQRGALPRCDRRSRAITASCVRARPGSTASSRSPILRRRPGRSRAGRSRRSVRSRTRARLRRSVASTPDSPVPTTRGRGQRSSWSAGSSSSPRSGFSAAQRSPGGPPCSSLRLRSARL